MSSPAPSKPSKQKAAQNLTTTASRKRSKVTQDDGGHLDIPMVKEEPNIKPTAEKRPLSAMQNTIENESLDPRQMKKAKLTGTTELPAAPVIHQGLTQVPVRRSGRNEDKPSNTPKKRVRRTKAQITADNARIEEEKARKEAENTKNAQAMLQMDLEEDRARKMSVTSIVRKFSDIENSPESEGEAFVGIAEISSSDSDESDLESDTEAKALKVNNFLL